MYPDHVLQESDVADVQHRLNATNERHHAASLGATGSACCLS